MARLFDELPGNGLVLRLYSLLINKIQAQFGTVLNHYFNKYYDILFIPQFLHQRLTMKYVLLLITLITCILNTAWAEPMTRKQGDEIIKELREIKQLLRGADTPQKNSKGSAQSNEGPGKFTMNIDLSKRQVLGNKDAPITMVAFTDFQCPYCIAFEKDTFKSIKEKFIDTGKVNYIIIDMPWIEAHSNAMPAAKAVRCAGDQGKYWEMEAAVFNKPNFTQNGLKVFAADMQLDTDKFNKCYDGEDHVDEIINDLKFAQSIGINGTPSFAVGIVTNGKLEGIQIVGAQPLSNFEYGLNLFLGKH